MNKILPLAYKGSKPYYIILLFFLVSILVSCKKGDEDPFLSLLSRKSRLCGDWKVYEATVNFSTLNYTESHNYTDGDKITIQLGYGSISGNYSWTFEINRNGTYRIYHRINIPYNQNYNSEEKGDWYFLSKNKDMELKNKECVAFQPIYIDNSNGTYELNSIEPKIYKIIQLKNNRIILECDQKYKKTDEFGTVTEVNEYDLITLVADKD